MSAIPDILSRVVAFARRQNRTTLVAGGAVAAIATLLLRQQRAAAAAAAAAARGPKSPHSQAVQSKKERDEAAAEKLLLEKRSKRALVNSVFLRKLRFILKIVLPGVRSKQFLLLALHTSFLVARTFVSIYVSRLDGMITKTIVARDTRGFVWNMTKWLLVAVPAVYVNSLIRFLEAKLALAFRSLLVDHVYTLYMSNEIYYRVDNLDSRIDNVDQLLTEDVSQFCNQLAHLWGQLSKPMLDVVLMTAELRALAESQGGDSNSSLGPAAIAATTIMCTGLILRLSTPPFGRMIAAQQQKYGELRAVHARLITHSEEIAFYRGHDVEESVLRRSYKELVSQLNTLYRRRIGYTMLEQFLMKYVWGATGLVMIALPTLNSEKKAPQSVQQQQQQQQQQGTHVEDVSQRTQDFITARGLLVNAADAVERMLSSWKDITELAGYTERVYELLTIFDDLKVGAYVKTQTGTLSAETRGVVYDDADVVDLIDVPIVTPNGDVLIEKLNLRIERGMHLLITGPNGCGKSSLFRMLGGLWPVRGGTLYKPSIANMFYIPQRPYLSAGCLREQFIYPDTTADMRKRGLSDDDLMELLKVVNLDYVVTREGGWDSLNDWRDVLSGGEKQRVGMARVFYHKPLYAILDECTSAVSIDVEGQMYEHAKAIGITLLTVTHRPSLWKYHTHLLKMDGQGGYTFTEFDVQNDDLSVEAQATKLRKQLAKVPELQAKLADLDAAIANQDLVRTRRMGSGKSS